MAVNAKDRVQRKLNFAIIDEVDSVLIDEARTPLIISGGFMKSANLYRDTDRFVKKLKENDGYIYDEKTKAVSLDEKGIAEAKDSFVDRGILIDEFSRNAKMTLFRIALEIAGGRHGNIIDKELSGNCIRLLVYSAGGQ